MCSFPGYNYGQHTLPAPRQLSSQYTDTLRREMAANKQFQVTLYLYIYNIYDIYNKQLQEAVGRRSASPRVSSQADF